jgi:hypothetical protein
MRRVVTRWKCCGQGRFEDEDIQWMSLKFQIANLVVAFIVLPAVLSCSGADSYAEAADLKKISNSWKAGESLPGKLLEYHSSQDGSCFPNPRGTYVLFSAITNYPLLREIVFRPEVDLRVFSNSVNQAIVLAGPTRFFADLATTLKERPELAKRERIKTLKKQSTVRQIVVDSLYITFADMPPLEARKVLDEISLELRQEKPWHDVYWRFLEKYESPYEEKLSDGTIIKGKRTKIGNLGDFVLPANRNQLFSYREDWMPKKHINQLFSANTGDILILFDKEDLSRFPEISRKQTDERYILYRVREVFSGL